MSINHVRHGGYSAGYCVYTDTPGCIAYGRVNDLRFRVLVFGV